jgi:phosphoribosylformylglycinamidine synthase
MKFGVIVFPGSNCDDDMVHVLGTVMGMEVVKIWHKSTSLDGFEKGDCIVLPGGFSYGDYLRSGAIASHAPIIPAIKEFAENGGLVWGICNGWQILCEMGLLPGALLDNKHQKFISKSVHLKVASTNSPITNGLQKGKLLKMPVAHAEGRYYAEPQTLRELEENDQVLFYYSNAKGEVNENTNINGSIANIAGIVNKERNIFGMMPHPERASERLLGSEDGKALFDSLIEAVDVKV